MLPCPKLIHKRVRATIKSVRTRCQTPRTTTEMMTMNAQTKTRDHCWPWKTNNNRFTQILACGCSKQPGQQPVLCIAHARQTKEKP